MISHLKITKKERNCAISPNHIGRIEIKRVIGIRNHVMGRCGFRKWLVFVQFFLKSKCEKIKMRCELLQNFNILHYLWNEKKL